MAKIEITVNGIAYPCRQTMGAMLRFKRETGKEVTQLNGDLSELCTYLWCCVASACHADGIEFGMSLMDFADNVDPTMVEEWVKAQQPAPAPDGEKKS